MTRKLSLRILSERFAIARLEPGAAIPDWVGGAITCVARTPSELSILCAEDRLPAAVRANRSWRCLEVVGPLDFGEVGILSSLCKSLADAGISVFVFSTFDTDYLLVRAERLAEAAACLRQAGHALENTP